MFRTIIEAPKGKSDLQALVEEPEAAQKTALCVDARLRASSSTGVATYAEAVAAALASLGHVPIRLADSSEGRFGGTAGPVERARRWWRARSAAAVPLVVRDGDFFARDIFRLAQVRFAQSGELLHLAAPGRGVMHWTYPIPARVDGWVNLYTVHDVIPLVAPSLSQMAAAPLRSRLDVIARSGDRLVTVSESSRDAIIETLHVPAEQVVDCGSAVPELTRGFGALPAGLVAGGYYLFCGMIEPRKNLARILAAWRASGTARAFVVAGPDAGGDLDLSDVVHLGYLSRPILLDVIAGARALIFPTLAEGFGLPVIEAMALGTPVVTSSRGALAETAAGAALTVDPENVSEIAHAIAAIDRDDGLCRDLAARGFDRAADFSLPAFGRRLLRLYAELAGDSALLP